MHRATSSDPRRPSEPGSRRCAFTTGRSAKHATQLDIRDSLESRSGEDLLSTGIPLWLRDEIFQQSATSSNFSAGIRRIELCDKNAWKDGRGPSLLQFRDTQCAENGLEVLQCTGPFVLYRLARNGRKPCLIGGTFALGFLHFRAVAQEFSILAFTLSSSLTSGSKGFEPSQGGICLMANWCGCQALKAGSM